jgi:protein-disulfide isomerase
MENQIKSSFITLPGAIIISATIIAIAIIWVRKPVTNTVVPAEIASAEEVNLVPVSNNDHIFGNPNAPIKIVEYSDASCPFCKTFNTTMTTVMNKYGAGGKVAWIYRHYPLSTPDSNGNVLHPNANREGQAMECAASLGGNDKFWAYEKRLYELTPSVTSKTPEGLDPKQLPIIAKEIGLNQTSFNECLTKETFKTKVESDLAKGVEAGVVGTPTSFIVLSDSINTAAKNYINTALIQYKVPTDMLYISKDKKIIVMSGALPEALISGLLSILIGN